MAALSQFVYSVDQLLIRTREAKATVDALTFEAISDATPSPTSQVTAGPPSSRARRTHPQPTSSHGEVSLYCRRLLCVDWDDC